MMLDVHIFLRFSTSKCSYFALISYKTLRKKYLYSELWSNFPAFELNTEKSVYLGISPYSVRVRENADQNNFEYEHFLHCDILLMLMIPFMIFHSG